MRKSAKKTESLSKALRIWAIIVATVMIVLLFVFPPVAPENEGVLDRGSAIPDGFSWTVVDRTRTSCEGRIFPGLDAPPEDSLHHLDHPDSHEWNPWDEIGSWDAWSVSVGGFPIAPGQIYGDFTAPADRSFTLHSLKVDVISRQAAPVGVVVERFCRPPTHPTAIAIDLDREPPSVMTDHDIVLSGEGTRIPMPEGPSAALTSFPQTLAPGESLPFLLWVNAYYCDCRWRIDVHWSSEGDAGTLTLDDDGTPFRTVGAGASDFYAYDGRFSQWVFSDTRYEGFGHDQENW